MSLLLENMPLNDKTTYRIGGPARYYAEPRSEQEILELYTQASKQNMPVFVLGKGSNVLVSDRGWDGLVMNVSTRFTDLSWNGCTAQALCGFALDDLVAQAVKRGYAGMEELSGIPGTVGGAVVMNAGAFSSCIADTLRCARVLKTDTLTVNVMGRDELGLGYRSSIIKGSADLVLSATFDLKPSDAALLDGVRENILHRRNEKQPLDYPNCGSVFKRPPGNYAGTMIETCGLKGLRYGEVEISPKHANFIVNRGNGSASDVRKVISHVRKTVYERFGVLLEPEVLFIGEFDEPLYQPVIEGLQ